ncbi:hypothetical protein N0V82_008179 [Gnomoniopsis sp. IMI 355080]|nr:hypothetical protein N0V82_008179 [Gnomoniopsis sp. IMI 355080]
MRPADEERFSALVSWATLHGASLHPALEIYKDDVTGFSMRVKSLSGPEETTLKPSDEVLACPLEISLSYLNALTGQPLSTTTPPDHTSKNSPQFPPELMKAAPHIIGRFYLMQQYLLGKASFWYPYIATLPQPDVTSSWASPPFWPEEDAEFLEGTNTGIAADTIRAQLKEEFKLARKALKEANFENWQDYTRLLHNWAYSIFASRSFRPSLVLPKAIQDSVLPAGLAIDDFSVLLPVFDIINHSMKAEVRWLVDHESADAKVCRFQTLDTYKPGDQIFNSYGKKTNSELLLSYGFFLPETDELHNDYVHMRKRAGLLPQSGTQQLPRAGAGSTEIPQDFLVSLRPMNDPSSFVGSSRQTVAKDARWDIRPEFAHIEDSLVWDLCLMVIGEESKPSFMAEILENSPVAGQVAQEHECLQRILSASASLPETVQQVIEKVKQLLLSKLGMDYDRLLSTAPGVSVDKEGNEIVTEVVPQTQNQAVALLYRAQVQKVLETVIETLVPDWQNGAEEE